MDQKGWWCWPINGSDVVLGSSHGVGVHGIGIVAGVVEGANDGEDGGGGAPVCIRFTVWT